MTDPEVSSGHPVTTEAVAGAAAQGQRLPGEGSRNDVPRNDDPLPLESVEQPSESSAPRRRGRWAFIIALSVGGVAITAGATVSYLALTDAFDEPVPRLTAAQVEAIDQEVTEREPVVDQLDEQRGLYTARLSDWTQSLAWAEEFHALATAPTGAVPNPGGTSMPGGDPFGRAFLDSIGATDVSVVFEAGPENCGYHEERQYGYLYVGGCFDGRYPNTLFMAWDRGAEDLVWPIFVHEAMHWFQDETYIQQVYLADLAGVNQDAYLERWEADASCRAVYVYGIPIEEYVDGSSPCTIDGWYEGFIADHIASLGVHLDEPLPEAFEITESSRP